MEISKKAIHSAWVASNKSAQSGSIYDRLMKIMPVDSIIGTFYGMNEQTTGRLLAQEKVKHDS
jgi:hypothetical protein